ncbi:MAG: sialate O-acetylesterase [Armatimonadota bacterium]|nr:sialate O-acetylesterase [Armatimonadota bacterium]
MRLKIVVVSLLCSLLLLSHLSVCVARVAGQTVPGLVTLSQPTSRAVYQRDAANQARIPIVGSYQGVIHSVHARCMMFRDGQWEIGPWTIVSTTPANGTFATWFSLPAGGWYRIEVHTRAQGQVVGETAVDKVGVGDVYITAGQSNSANHGLPCLKPSDDRIAAMGYSGWQFAADPQPIATGSNGTPWPVLGDFLASRMNVPIGFISVGYGGTSVHQWLPGSSYYQRLRYALTEAKIYGVRAILWHQGENDAYSGTTTDQYAQRLQAIINQSRRDIGWNVPWFIAGVSYGPTFLRERMTAIRDAQLRVVNNTTVFAGPTTDDLSGPQWRIADLVHFNEAGMREHARRWANILLTTRIPFR